MEPVRNHDATRFVLATVSRTGITLELEWLDTAYGAYRGIPVGILQRAFYETADSRSQE
jgi:hypothetical protein